MKNWILPLKNLTVVALLCLPILNKAEALNLKKDLVYGVFTGFGGAGVEEDKKNSSGGTFTDSRNEGPGMVGFSVEMYLSEKWTLALSHTRGFKLGPFRSGVGFTGVTVRRYFLRPVPYLPSNDLANSATIQRWAPFVGLRSGIAIGSIKRDDAAGDTSGSGIYFGVALGVDYPLYHNMFLRPQLFTSATFMDDSDTPAVLEELGLGCSFLFRL